MRTYNSNLLRVASFAICILLSFTATTQDYTTTKEKIYIQTDHVFYQPGETLYFKLYLVNATDNTPGYESSVAYAELISPSGTIVKKSNYKIADGYASGSFDFAGQAPGGVYKIRSYTNWMRNEKQEKFFSKEITLLKVLAPRILMKLDFPQKGYGAGDEVMADFSMRSLDDKPIRNYEGSYTASIGGEAYTTKSFKTNETGSATIRFRLPHDLSTADGLLNIKVSYDAYTESISSSIPIVLNKIDLQFMPEGGTLVAGIASIIAFKALNENGKAADIKGEVQNSKGKTITSFESFHMGMGKFLFTPQPGESYKAIIHSPANIAGQYELPHASANGVSMQISKAQKQIAVSLFATQQMEVSLQAATRNTIHYSKKMVLKKGANRVLIDEFIFPIGIAQFTLYTAYDKPLAERLVFLNDNKRLYLSVTTGKSKYLPREKVNLTIKTTDETGKPVPANCAVSVVDDKLWSFADDKQHHILSWLLLGSELRGKIEEPQFYFKEDEPKAIAALDLLMLTQGYRYFDYIDYVDKDKLRYLPDQDNILTGQILGIDEKPVAAKVFLINTISGGYAAQLVTDKNGMFSFAGLEPKTSYHLFAQALNKKNKIKIRVLQNGPGGDISQLAGLKSTMAKPLAPGIVPTVIPVPVKAGNDKNNVPGPGANFGQHNALEEVVVIGYGVQRKLNLTGAITVINTQELHGATNLATLLQGKLAGLQVVTSPFNGPDTRVAIRGMGSQSPMPPLIVMNGIPTEQVNLNTLDPNDIESVVVLKDAGATALYGGRAASGVIIIESKKMRNERIRFNFSNKYYYASLPVSAPGDSFSIARKFYVPEYSGTVVSERTDFRETIYWNPVVQTDKNGSATVSFYNSDANTTFRTIAEGIGFNGKPGRFEATYTTQNPLQADAKIPPYLTVGDKALIPLVIKNNGDQPMQLNIRVVLPGAFRAGAFDPAVTVQPKHSVQLQIPVEALTVGKGTIQLLVAGGIVKEVISLPIISAAKGFPVIETFSGNRSALHEFTVGKIIPGSLHCDLKFFNTLEGQLVDGIEAMLREPYGCFEQVSSTTYPNIYVLKYLRESGRSRPEIERKALSYLEAGYKRLISFETTKNGFEWFGKTPPHEALTAYGLLEFTDMQEFINVDKNMLERTKKFLLSRRDGNGAFKIMDRGYDQFASVPNKVANMYIVYALARAGMGKEIQQEYDTAVKKALASGDSYQMSLMAIAAHTMQDNAMYNQLMQALDKQYQQPDMNAETSVVNSRGVSLRVETTALYAIALMRAADPAIGKIAILVSKILKEKTYYGYGSTQSTVLALQAIIEYSKLAARVSEDAPVSFTVNSKPVIAGDTIAAQLHEGGNQFAVQYPLQNKAIPYSLEIAYNTLTPPGSGKAALSVNTRIKAPVTKVGETVRMDIEVINRQNVLQPMAVAKIGIPAGLAIQPWQLKEIMEKNQAAYYEVFDNYLVFYWMGFAPGETKLIHLDLKAEIAGTYKAKASTAYLYYTPEYKNWNEGLEVEVK